MKKRLLITSIVMMLVVAVALSTATYAWFTSSATVTSSAITMTAATNDAASLGISWTEGNYGPSITAVGPTGGATFKPACPTELSTSGTVTTTDVTSGTHNIAFNTAYATPSAGDMVFLAAGATTDVYRWNDGEGGHTSFFVKNMSPANPITTVRLTPTITGTDASLVRIAVFVKTSTVGSNFELKAVLAEQESYTYTAVEDDTVLNTNSGNVTYYKKYLGKYVAAVPGTAGDVTNGTADFEDGVTEAEENQFYTRTNTATHAKATCGTIAANASVNAMGSVDCAENVIIASNLAAQDYVEVVVMVWEDAVALGDADAAKTSIVEFSIGTV